MSAVEELNEMLVQEIFDNHSLEGAKKALLAGANPNHVMKSGAYKGSMLKHASSYSFQNFWYEFGKILIEFGADVNEIVNHQSLPMLAFNNGGYKFALYLLEHGSDMNYCIPQDAYKEGQSLRSMLEYLTVENEESKKLKKFLEDNDAHGGFLYDW